MKPSLAFVLAAMLLLALPIIIFAPALFSGKMLWGADIQTLEFPFKIAAHRSLALHEWPLWMPEVLGGMPGMAAANLVFLYPSELIICLLGLPAHAGFGLDSALQVFLAGLGMLLFLRRLGLGPGASLLGALFYALSGTQVSLLYAGHINNIKAYAMIPWAFWGAHKGFAGRSWFGWGLCGAALALQILGNGMQIYAYTVLGVAAYGMWLSWRDGGGGAWKRAALGYATAILFSAVLSAPQLWPSLQYKPYSWREGFSYESFISWSFHPKEAIGWIVPGFYGWREPWYHGDWSFCLTTEYFGLLPWALAFAAVAAQWRDGLGMPRFLALFSVACFLIAIGKWTPIHLLFFHLPIYSGFRTWTRFLSLMTFAVCALGAYGWEALAAAQPRRASMALRGALVFCAIAVFAALATLHFAVPSKPDSLELSKASSIKAFMLAPAIALLCWGVTRKWALWALLVAALGMHIADGSEIVKRFVEFKDPAEITQRPGFLAALPSTDAVEPWRIISLPGVWSQNASVIYGYEDLLGYHGVQMAAPIKLQNAMQGRQMDWLSMMNVRFLLSTKAIPGLPLVSDGPVKIYSNPAALPRAWLVSSVRHIDNEDSAYKALSDPGFSPQREVLLQENLSLPGGSAAAVNWVGRSRNQFELQTQADHDTVLVVSNFWYPSWKCSVDGVSAPILKADAALQGVFLGPGRHQVRFAYDPTLFAISCLACLLGLAGLFALLRFDRLGYIGQTKTPSL